MPVPDDDAAFLAAFETRTIPFAEWSHRAHIRMAFNDLSRHPFKDSNDFCDRNPHLLQRTLMRVFYSQGRLFSPEAKRSFVEPDLAPLPRLPASNGG